MMFPDKIRLIYIIVSLFTAIGLVILTINMYRKINVYRNYIAWPIAIGILSIVAYCLFLLSKDHFHAVLFDSMFFIGTDWLAMTMFIFSIAYTGILEKYIRQIIYTCSVLCLIDSISLFINNFTFHMFDLIWVDGAFGISYWGNAFLFPHYIHLSICYLMVVLTFAFFAISSFTTPQFFRRKYLGVLIAYLIVIVANFICYTVNVPIDVSVVLYGFLAGFICYYSTYSFPQKLLNNTLAVVNESISDGILYFSDDGECIYANKIAKKIFSDGEAFSPYNAEKFHDEVKADFMKNQPIKNQTFMVDGKAFRYKVEYKIEYVSGTEIGACLKLIDKTVELNAYEKERYIAVHDELTGLFNRTGFLEEVDLYIQKFGTKNKLMITSNIRDFKLLNELFGEKTGDTILLRQAIILQEAAHTNSIFGRMSDDKFALFVDKEYMDEDRFSGYMDSLKSIVADSFYELNVSTGLYNPQGRIETASAMYDKTLMALEEISSDYSKNFNWYDSALMEKMLDEENITSDFQTAIDKGQIEMYLQPILDVGQQKFGAEALCRWNHPLKGLMLPGSFLPVLEKAGLIYQMDEYIWNCAAKKLKEWSDKGCSNCFISVNVSVKDFFYTDIYKTFMQMVEEYDISPSSLHIEITETVLMSDFAKAHILCDKLLKSGFVVAIDNFGNGYSSLNMLKDFKADTIKMDMSFIQNTKEAERSQIILESIIKMARNLGMNVVGEGVENREQYDILRKLHCEVIQGNYLYKPLTVSEYENLFVKYFFTN